MSLSVTRDGFGAAAAAVASPAADAKQPWAASEAADGKQQRALAAIQGSTAAAAAERKPAAVVLAHAAISSALAVLVKDFPVNSDEVQDTARTLVEIATIAATRRAEFQKRPVEDALKGEYTRIAGAMQRALEKKLPQDPKNAALVESYSDEHYADCDDVKQAKTAIAAVEVQREKLKAIEPTFQTLSLAMKIIYAKANSQPT